MENTLRDIREHKVFENFYNINQIPRGSFHEKAISDYLVSWAKKKGFYVHQDKLKNVLIRKPASAGLEHKKGILLQAHIDMVCEKTPESSHDFSKDPIPWVVDGDWLTTGGETTLGADDGIGVALAMAILEDETLNHPLLEALFTVAEEEDLSGAAGFDTSLLKSSYLINLDNAKETEILCGSCGGEAVELTIPVNWKNVPTDWSAFELSLTGLKGGHSGEDIHRGHGNANEMLARLLMDLEKQTDYALCALHGGTFRLAIPREAKCTLVIPSANENLVQTFIHEFKIMLKKEYQSSAELLDLTLTSCDEIPDKCCSARELVSCVLLSPNGIRQMNSEFEHLVSSSVNLGELYLEGNQFRLVYEIRSASASGRDYTANVILRLGSLFHGTSKIHSSYPSWIFQPHSLLRATAKKVFEVHLGKEPEVHTVHAGLECGCFFETKEDLDAISIGPDCLGLHSPQERLNIPSTFRIYKILQELLCQLASY